MYYVIQENVFKEDHFMDLIRFLKHNELGHEIIPWRPFTEEINIKTERKDIWAWGSVNLSKIANKYGWVPGSMYNANHDLEVYAEHYSQHMLNSDGIIMNFTDTLPAKYQYFFARPTQDTKSFSGQCFERTEWERWVQEAINNGTEKILTEETRVLIAPIKDTQQEVRCWVVGGEVVSLSRYKLGSKVVYKNYDDEWEAVEFAEHIVAMYQPADAFVLDICLHDNRWKVVEINCINCSGFYHVNMGNLMLKIEDTFNGYAQSKLHDISTSFDSYNRNTSI